MHYCFITTGDWSPGPRLGYTVRRDLGNALARQGVQVTFLLDDLPGNRVDLGFEPAVQKVFVADPTTRAQFKNRRRALQEVAPDFVQLLIQAVKPFLAVRGVPSVRVVGEWDEWPNPDLKGWQKIFGAVRARWLRKHAVLHLVSTHYSQAMFKRKWNLPTLYLPFAAYLNPNAEEGWNPFAGPTAVYVGNLYPLWGHGIIFRAAEILAKRGKFPHIAVVGHGLEFDHWQNWIKERNLHNIQMPGFLSNEALWQYMRHAQVLLFPLRDEEINHVRCPSKIFAYMQAGRPLITNRVGEIVYLLGDAPTYVPQGDEAFAEGIEAAMSGPRAPDVNYHPENHTWDARAKALIEALERLK